MVKEFKYRGKTLEELLKMGLSELVQVMPSRIRRSLKRGFTEDEKRLVEKVQAGKKTIKTHSRDMVIIPSFVGKTIKVHNGKEWVDVNVTLEMMGHYLGEFVQTRKPVKHSGPGIGATRGSRAQSVK